MVLVSDVKRPYRSPARVAAAAQTRTAILSAAGELFLAQGYVATTIAQIADRASVSKPTVFAVGAKPELFAEVRNRTIAGDDEPLPIVERPAWRRMVAQPDAAKALHSYAGISGGINQRYAPLNQVLQQSAAAAPEMAALYARSEGERLTGAEFLVRTIASKANLRLPAGRATDAVWVLNAPDSYQRLVSRRGWTHRQYVSWLGNALVSTLLTG